MNIINRAVLLLAAAAVCARAAPTPEECEGLSKRLPTLDRHKVLGDWVMMAGFTDSPKGWEEWAGVQSMYTEIRLLPDNTTIQLVERNLMANNCCSTYSVNMSMPADAGENYTLQMDAGIEDKDGVVSPFNESLTAHFYATCPDCMLLIYESDGAQFLLSYRRDGQHRDVEQLRAAHHDLIKIAECLGIPQDHSVKYDGVKDFCHKKSAPNTDQS